MPEKNWTTAVEKLVILTRTGELKWRSKDQLAPPRDNVIGHFFVSDFAGKTLACYEYRYRHFEDEDVWFWSHDVALEFVNRQGALEWTFPETPHRSELLDAIRYAYSDAGGFLDQLFSDQPSHEEPDQ